MTSKRKLRRRIEKLQDTVAIMREFDRAEGVPSEAFPPLVSETRWVWRTPNTAALDFTVRCICPPNRGDNYAGTCLIHDVHTSRTAITEARA